MSEEKIAAIPSWAVATCFEPAERAVLAYTDALVLDGGRVPDGVFDELRRHLSDEAVLELTYITAMYEMHAVISRALRLEWDDRDDPIVEVAAPEGAASRDIGADIAAEQLEPERRLQEAGGGVVGGGDLDAGVGLAAVGEQEQLRGRAGDGHRHAVGATASWPSPRRRSSAAARARPAPCGPAARDIGFSRRHSSCSRSPSIGRGAQPSVARRTSSWWTKNSTVLASRSMGSRAAGDHRGGPVRTRSTRSPHAPDATWRRTFSLWPASGRTRMPMAASGRRSRITRWAARSRVAQPSSRVGASGPTAAKQIGQLVAFVTGPVHRLDRTAGTSVRPVSRRCERPGCGEVASVAYGFDPERSMVWLEVLGPAGPAAGALCRRHADAMVLPRGWWLQDRRSDAALFTAPDPSPSTAVYRPRRRRRPPADPAPLPLDDTTTTAAGADGIGADAAALTDGPAPVPAWSPAFDAGDDLDGLLAAKTPLLARAFRQDPAPPAT